MINLSSEINLIDSGSISCSLALILLSSVSSLSSSLIGTTPCKIIGPVSIPSSTKCTVQPVNLDPYSRACLGA